MRWIPLIALSITSAAVAQSDDPMNAPLITDRPDFTESTQAIPTGHFQPEAGPPFVQAG